MIEQHLPAAPAADTLAARVERHLLYTVGGGAGPCVGH